MLRALGLGPLLEAEGCPIRAIRVTDGAAPTAARPGAARFLEFDSADIDPVEPLGTMIENRLLRTALLDAVRQSPRTSLHAPATIAAVHRHATHAEVQLEGGAVLRAPVIVAADGRRSAQRAAAGIRIAEWRYDGHAIVSMLAHEKPHDNVASELFFPDGPFAQLPMLGLSDGRNRSALVWTVAGKDVAGITALGPRGFAHEVEKRIGGFLGRVEQLAPAVSWPLGLHHAERYWAERLILVGDAAHGIHPIAGQGLNMGLRDVAALAQVLVEAARIGIDLGSADVARRYERWRRADNSATAFATDGLARLFSIPGKAASTLRTAGLATVNRIAPLRKGFMAVARGEAGDLPPLLRGELG
jgi:2-octaprenyl-6-methoxyphenol hydroxylase